MSTRENITYFFDENDLQREHYIDLALLQHEMDCISLKNEHEHDNEEECNENEGEDAVFLMMKDYELNYSIKQMLIICEYYGIRANKLKKQDIIELVVAFENSKENLELYMKRKELWYYINELKNDKIMKKFVIWDKNN